ncbi:hypothetical protein SGFS_079050 [Streptomyces graminofaciens]|uniref:Glycosyl hydrolase family 32 C-terminal domain-containing protein n=1 Tax=Streptomyces graminofaciens TaxID=68212 RepID=A0ABM7FJZ9_9ACTN|nr:GH32 C-terminal domain-containing protein [Streptomyces graminofaciens]BBC36611.1 hypothetical protein SGFS_079050 [Streptomyces graminofaciens]
MQVPGASVELRVIVDRSIVEIHLASGQTLTFRFYPTGDRPWRLLAHTTGTRGTDFAVDAGDLTADGFHQRPLLAGQGQDV